MRQLIESMRNSKTGVRLDFHMFYEQGHPVLACLIKFLMEDLTRLLVRKKSNLWATKLNYRRVSLYPVPLCCHYSYEINKAVNLLK